jgi:hypothetical protein
MALDLTPQEFEALLHQAVDALPAIQKPYERLEEAHRALASVHGQTSAEAVRTRKAAMRTIQYNLLFEGPTWFWLSRVRSEGQRFPDEVMSLSFRVPGDSDLGDTVGRDVVYEFIAKFLKELRDIICSKRGDRIAKGADLSAKGTATLLAAWIADSLGMQSPIALALGTMIVWVFGSALHGAFCNMSDAAVKKALGINEKEQEPKRLRKEAGKSAEKSPGWPKRPPRPKKKSSE